MRGARTGVVVAAVLCAVALSGCTPEPVIQPAPSSTPTVATPAETAAERQERLDYAAAEKAYRTFRAEFGRVLRDGGAEEPTKVMNETAGGEYLATFTEVIRGYKKLQSREVGRERIVYVRHNGYEADQVSLAVCEDSRATKTLRKNGEEVAGELRTAVLELRLVSGDWKIWSGEGELVDSCD